jgi:ActR/RegA family two-component response regulator
MEKDISILIVDDDPSFSRTLADTLEVEGFRVNAFTLGAKALAWVEEQPPTVAIVDLKLADLPGIDVIAGIKKRSPTTKCIVLTGFASQTSYREALDLGVFSYLEKPHDVEDLLSAIRKAIIS